ncbi:MAG: FecR family protein [Pseudomonadota bacterium]|nr:FecR family protein [Pseudomonadota bacterium]
MQIFKVLTSALLLTSTVTAFADAGITLLSSGDVVAAQSEGDQRVLNRRSPIFTNDSITTGPDAKAQFRMKDGALFALSENSEWLVEEYKFEDNDDDIVTLRLIKGGLRTISGAVGKGDPTRYKLETPVGSIGIRGTHYEVKLLDDGGMVLGAYEGTIAVTTAAGEVELGENARAAFAAVSASGAVSLSDTPPAAMAPPSSADLVEPGQANRDLLLNATQGQGEPDPAQPEPEQDSELRVEFDDFVD